MPSGSRAGFGNAVAVLAADAKEEAPLVDRGGVDSTVGSEGQGQSILSVVSAVLHCDIGVNINMINYSSSLCYF